MDPPVILHAGCVNNQSPACSRSCLLEYKQSGILRPRQGKLLLGQHRLRWGTGRVRQTEQPDYRLSSMVKLKSKGGGDKTENKCLWIFYGWNHYKHDYFHCIPAHFFSWFVCLWTFVAHWTLIFIFSLMNLLVLNCSTDPWLPCYPRALCFVINYHWSAPALSVLC